MKNVFLILCALILVSVSCKKNDGCAYTDPNVIAPTAEKNYLRNYLVSNSIMFIEDSSGVFYTITNQGSGISPTVCSTITAKYVGTLIPSGTHFDSDTSSAGFTYPLGQLVNGWKKVLPKIQKGGSMTMYIPPSLGYGQENQRDRYNNIVIPGNSYLKFKVELLNVQ
jgi:FKBP-type peptidyl-prolyl cis-trans isomerase FkpA